MFRRTSSHSKIKSTQNAPLEKYSKIFSPEGPHENVSPGLLWLSTNLSTYTATKITMSKTASKNITKYDEDKI